MAGTEGFASVDKSPEVPGLADVQTRSNPDHKTKIKDVNREDLRLLSWLGRRDSNPRMPGPKPGALPLGHVPINARKLYHRISG